MPERSQENLHRHKQKLVIVFIFNLKNGTFQSLGDKPQLWFSKENYLVHHCTVLAKSRGDPSASNQAQIGRPGLIMQFKKYLSSLLLVVMNLLENLKVMKINKHPIPTNSSFAIKKLDA